jgi:hypothetical protein
VQAAIAAGGAEALPAYAPYVEQFEKLAERLAAAADAELAAGRTFSARSRYLRAASYYNCVLFFLLGADLPGREAEIYGAMQRCWAAAAALLDPVFQRVEVAATVRFRDLAGAISTRSITIPAYWARASGAGPKPTVLLNNGSDAQLIDLYAFGGAAALTRGYNVLMFEGPGQGSMLFEQNIPFTPYWEDVVTPLVDFVVAQPETDAARIGLTGWSFGGLLVMRAAAQEHRISAVVADPGFWNNTQPWQPLIDAMISNFGSVSNANWRTLYDATTPEYGVEGRRALKFLVNKRGEIYASELHSRVLTGEVLEDIVGLLDAVAAFTGDEALFGRITSHVLLNEYESDVFFSDQGPQVQAWLTAAASVASYTFTASEGAEYHCAPMAPQFRNEVVFDWLDTVLGVVPTPPPGPPAPVPPAPPALAATGAGGGSAGGVAAVAAVAAGTVVVGATAARAGSAAREKTT